MTTQPENGRGLSWLVERWATAMAAALNEAGVALETHEWRPVPDWSGMDAAASEALWWNERISTPSGETVSVGIGPLAQALLGELAVSKAGDSPALRFVTRAAEIFTGTSGFKSDRLASSPQITISGNGYAVRFRLIDGRAFEIGLACADTSEKPLAPPAFASQRMGMLLKVEVPVTISLGKANLPLKDTLKLARGSVVELDRTFNDPVEVVVNGRVVALGDIVVVEEKYAVRIREIHREESNQIWSSVGAVPSA
jgi:flagellar motor switch protein FliN